MPVADAYVSAAAPTANYGTLSALRVDGSPIVRSYLRFTVSGLSGTVSKETLRIYANSAQSPGSDARGRRQQRRLRCRRNVLHDRGQRPGVEPVPGRLCGRVYARLVLDRQVLLDRQGQQCRNREEPNGHDYASCRHDGAFDVDHV
jgi:hypothetical protein